jgi:predicted amidohydrolase
MCEWRHAHQWLGKQDLKHWEQWLGTAGAKGADIALLPELSNGFVSSESDWF